MIAEMSEPGRRRRREWRAAGKQKAERMIWLTALVGALVVIGLTLVAGHLRKENALGSHLDRPTLEADAGGESQ
jgi:hypothetical protein